MADDRIFQEALTAIQNGQRSRARDLLTRLLRQDQANVEYWLYMSAVVETPKERTFCLENALKYDPKNQTALNGLVMLGALPASDDLRPVKPMKEKEWDFSEMYSGEGQKGSDKQRTPISAAHLVTLFIIGLAAVSLLLIGIIGNPFYEPSSAQASGPGATIAPLITSGPTPTRHRTATPEITVPVTDTDLPKPTLPSIYPEEPYTPTPYYVDTPHPDSEAYESGLLNLGLGNYGVALSLFEQALDNTNNALDVKYYIALTRLLSGDYESAKRDFTLIIQQDDTFAPAYVGRAQSILAMSPNSLVSSDLYKAIALDPQYLEGHHVLAAYRLNRDEPEEALPIAQAILKIDPDNALGYHYLAKAYIGLEEYDKALEAAQKSQELDVTYIENYFTLAYALILNDLDAEAYGPIELYLSYPESQENAMAWYVRGRAIQAYGGHTAALEYFEEAYSIRKDIYEMSYYWALSYSATGSYDNAMERLLVPLERFPRWFEPHVAEAQTYYLMEEYADAKEALERGAGYADTDKQKAMLYYWRGLIYEALGYPTIAEDNWERLLDLPEEVVPAEWLEEALERIPSTSFPTATGQPATPTRVPTATSRP